MDNRAWRNVSLVLAAVCMMLVGFSAALLYVGSSSPAPSIQPTASVQVSPSASATASASASPTASPSASATASVKPTASPKPTPNAPMASVTFSNMQLDASKDPDGKARTFTFTSDGPGPVTAAVVKTSPKGTTKLCWSANGGAPKCQQGAKPVYNLTALGTHNTWTITLIGVDIMTPTVDVAFTWPENAPDITLTHGRLQGLGADSPLNGVTARFKARATGSIEVSGSWPPLILDAVMTCADVTNSPAVNGGEKQITSAGSGTATFTATADHLYEVQLRDLSADSMRPDLTFELKFP